MSKKRVVAAAVGCLAMMLAPFAADADSARAARSVEAPPGGGGGRTEVSPTLSEADYFHNFTSVSGAFGSKTGQLVIPVSGMPSVVEDVNVYMRDLSAVDMASVRIRIKSPEGRIAHLLGGACKKPPIVGDQAQVVEEDLTFDDESQVTLPETAEDLTHNCWHLKGTVKPATYAPQDSLSVLRGAQANGDWTVFVSSDYTHVFSTVAGGFSIGLTAGNLPDTTIVSGPRAGEVTGRSVSFAFTSTEPGAVFECRLEPESYAPCTSPFVATNLAYKTHDFSVRSKTLAGTDLSAARVVWKVEAPDTFASSSDTGAGKVPGTVTFRFGSNRPDATFECALDSASTFTPCISPHSLTGLTDGPHAFRVRAKTVDEVDDTPAVGSWVTGPPETISDRGPADNEVVPGPASFRFASDLSRASFECALDGAPFLRCDTPHIRTGLAAGAHTLQVRAVLDGRADPTPLTYRWITPAGTTDPPTPGPRTSPNLRVSKATWRHHRIIVLARTVPTATGKVQVVAKVRVGGKTVIVKRATTLIAGQGKIALRMRGKLARARRAALVVTYPGDTSHAPQQVSKPIRKATIRR